MKDLNTTPLIDVMLVLLVMLIMIVPVQLHEVPVDLPGPSQKPIEERPVTRIDITAGGAILWNGAAVSPASLPVRFRRLVADPAQPVLQIAANGESRYEIFDETLAAAKKAGVKRLGMVDNARFVEAIAGR